MPPISPVKNRSRLLAPGQLSSQLKFDMGIHLRNNQYMIKYEILPADILSRIPQVKQLLQVERCVIFAYLFGGMAAGRITPLSDVDIAVYITNESDLSAYKLKLFDELTDVLGTAELDLIILNNAPLSLSGRIIQQKKVLVDKDPHLRYVYESLTLRKFFDFRVKEEEYFRRRYARG